MLLRCLQASSSFEEEWAALGGPRLQTGLRRGKPPGQTGRPSVKGTFEMIENSNHWILREDIRLDTLRPPFSCDFCFKLVLKEGNLVLKVGDGAK